MLCGLLALYVTNDDATGMGVPIFVSQATDDAKRAMIARAPTAIVGHSWLSNLNTTCTIKSAPPRSPEVSFSRSSSTAHRIACAVSL